jgi:response regulator RpfG family c-di-GMP phosphodiesterase
MCPKPLQDELTSHIPIITLKEIVDRLSKHKSIEKASIDYLEKPFHKEELQLLIKILLELLKSLQQNYRMND